MGYDRQMFMMMSWGGEERPDHREGMDLKAKIRKKVCRLDSLCVLNEEEA